MVRIPYSFILPDSTMQEQLNEQLRLNQRPFIYAAIGVTSAILIEGMMLLLFTDEKFDAQIIVINLMIFVGSILVLSVPKYSTKIILIFRSVACIIIVHAHIQIFEGYDDCYDSVDFFKKFFVKR